MQIILASASPRRKALLEQIGIKPEIISSMYQEVNYAELPADVVETNAKGKLADVVKQLNNKSDVVVAADTVVILDGRIFGKPVNEQDARQMLQELSARKHQVITGVAIYYKNEIRYNYAVTDVYMKDISAEDIDAYVKTDEPRDKAGGYAIQGKAAVFVERIDGCYSNVVGLPLPLLYDMFSELSIKVSDLDF